MIISEKYKTFLKYIFVALISFLIDIAFFNLFLYKLVNNSYKIIIATILARIISSLINFFLNKNKVFNSNERLFISLIKYYCLVIIQMLISAFLVNNIYNLLTINPTFIKVPVELFIFICNYLIQKMFIFKRKNEDK